MDKIMNNKKYEGEAKTLRGLQLRTHIGIPIGAGIFIVD